MICDCVMHARAIILAKNKAKWLFGCSKTFAFYRFLSDFVGFAAANLIVHGRVLGERITPLFERQI